MKSTQGNLSLSVLTLAVRSALAVMAVMPLAAMADDAADAAAAVAAQAVPTNTIEVGVLNTTKDSAKFGEYTGLNKKGTDLDASFSLKGGDGYGQGTGTTTWSATGRDLGTTSRELGVAASNQGKWKVGIDYDQLRHNISDDYQTPYVGGLGSASFVLPASFGSIANAQNPGLSVAQQNAFHQQDVYSQRENTSLKAGYNIDSQLGITFDYKHVAQSGSKLMSTGTDGLTAAMSGSGGVAWGGEKVAVLMNPTVSKTENFNLALNWKGDKAFGNVGYYGSLYHDDNTGFTFSNPWQAAGSMGTLTALPVDSMSTPPSNQFHQLNLTGGYHVSPTTKLVGGLSYAHNTQNESYTGTYTPVMVASLPAGSLDASVTMKHADLKLTNRTTNDLNLAAGVTYNERDNKTASRSYTFLDLGDSSATNTNTPESWKHTQLDFSADYRLSGSQHLHAAYGYDDMKRWCNNDAANVAAGYYTTTYTTPATSCVQVPENKENNFDLMYKLGLTDSVNLRASYRYSDRNAEVNSTFYNPMMSQSAGYEYPGFVAFFQGSRKENQAKLAADWQVNERLSVDLSGKYAKDDYDSTYGVQQGAQFSINLDATFAYSDTNSVSAFVTQQHRTRDVTDGYKVVGGTNLTTATTKLVNGVVVPAGATQYLPFQNGLTDDQLMLGVNAKQKGLFGGRLELAEDLTYSLGKTDYSTSYDWVYVSNQSTMATTSCSAVTAPATSGTTTCGSFPAIKNEVISFKLNGAYKIDKSSKVLVGYQFQHLKSSDPTYYDYYTYGYKSGTLPTYQQAPNYNVSSLFVGYAYSFQ